MIYDVGIDSLHRAIRALDEGNVQERVAASNKFFAVIAELRSALNYENGGDVARRLGRFYQIARCEILEANIRNDRAMFEKHAALFASLREAWKTVEREYGGAAPAPETAPITMMRAPQENLEPTCSSWSA